MMRPVLAAVSAGVGVFVVGYILATWYLLRWPLRDLWRGDYVPPVYDGKEPYERWAAAMERGRRLQARHDA